MTCNANHYVYGFGGCCRCECPVDLASQPACLSAQHGHLDLYFFFCPKCATHLCEAGIKAQERAVSRVAKMAQNALPKRTHLAVTTSIALHAHGGDLVRAYELGIDMPRPVHDAIVSGDADATFLPFGWEA